MYWYLLLTFFSKVLMPLLKSSVYQEAVQQFLQTTLQLLLTKNYKVPISETCSFFLATQLPSSPPFNFSARPHFPGLDRLCLLHKTLIFGHVYHGYKKVVFMNRASHPPLPPHPLPAKTTIITCLHTSSHLLPPTTYPLREGEIFHR